MLKTPIPNPNIRQLPTFISIAEERLHLQQRLAAAFRLFSRFGFDEGIAGHWRLIIPRLKTYICTNQI